MSEIKNSIFAGIAFTLLIGVCFYIIFPLQITVVIAPVSGLAFGLGIYFFVTNKAVKKQTEIELESGEKIIHSGGANHFVGFEGVGGKLYLLSDRLEFKSHSFNIQNHQLSIPLQKIKEIRFYNVSGFVPKGLEIITTESVIEKFVVGGRAKWKEEIDKARSI